jgi:hypothetical protein
MDFSGALSFLNLEFRMAREEAAALKIVASGFQHVVIRPAAL